MKDDNCGTGLVAWFMICGFLACVLTGAAVWLMVEVAQWVGRQ